MKTITVTVALKMDIKNLINNTEELSAHPKNTNNNSDITLDSTPCASPSRSSSSGESPPYKINRSSLSPRSSFSILDKIHDSPKVLDTIMKTKKKGIYKCTHCPLHFTNFLELAKHYDENGIKREFHCPEEDCPWHVLGLPNRNELNRHIKSQHQPRQFSCRMGCDYKFHRADTRNRHEKQVHLNENSRLNKSQRNRKAKNAKNLSRSRSNSDVTMMTSISARKDSTGSHYNVDLDSSPKRSMSTDSERLYHSNMSSPEYNHHRSHQFSVVQGRVRPTPDLQHQYPTPAGAVAQQQQNQYEMRQTSSLPMFPMIQPPPPTQYAIVYQQIPTVIPVPPQPSAAHYHQQLPLQPQQQASQYASPQFLPSPPGTVPRPQHPYNSSAFNSPHQSPSGKEA